MSKQTEIPMQGEGVAPLKINELDKAIAKYQRKKEARCAVSPDEIAAKNEVRGLLHQHRDKLPVNAEGVPFYRCEDRDYVLEEKLRIRKVDQDGEEED